MYVVGKKKRVQIIRNLCVKAKRVNLTAVDLSVARLLSDQHATVIHYHFSIIPFYVVALQRRRSVEVSVFICQPLASVLVLGGALTWTIHYTYIHVYIDIYNFILQILNTCGYLLHLIPLRSTIYRRYQV